MSKSAVSTIGKKITPAFLKPVVRRVYKKTVNLLKRGDPYFFSDVQFESITACNRRCSYCPNSVYERGLAQNKKLMDEDLFRKIVDELAKIKYSGKISPVFYGEPLLDSRLEELAVYMRKKLPMADILIFSNGDLMNLDIYKKLIAAGVDLFVISEHGSAMSENMRFFLENFEKADYKDSYLHDTAYILKGEKKATVLYRDIKKNKNLFNRGGILNHLSKKEKNLRCNMPSDILLIDYQGNVLLCCNDYFSKYAFGNLENESIADIWKKENFKRIRRELRNGVLKLDICKKCKGIN